MYRRGRTAPICGPRWQCHVPSSVRTATSTVPLVAAKFDVCITTNWRTVGWRALNAWTVVMSQVAVAENGTSRPRRRRYRAGAAVARPDGGDDAVRPPSPAVPRRRRSGRASHQCRGCLASATIRAVETVEQQTNWPPPEQRSQPRAVWSCSLGPGSRPTRGSPTSVARTASGLVTPPPRRPRTSSFYLRDPEVRRAAWQTRVDGRMFGAEPNSGHHAIVELQRQEQALRRRHPERRRAAPARRHGPRQGDRGPRHGALVHGAGSAATGGR